MQPSGALYPKDEMTKRLLLCGAIAGPLYTLAWIAGGAIRPDYDPLRHPVSSLSIGEFGWTQVPILIVTGLLMLAFTFGLQRVLRDLGSSTRVALSVGAFAIGVLGAAIFVTDPVLGYPLLGRPICRSNIPCPAASTSSLAPSSSLL
jgi:hypothetical protein